MKLWVIQPIAFIFPRESSNGAWTPKLVTCVRQDELLNNLDGIALAFCTMAGVGSTKLSLCVHVRVWSLLEGIIESTSTSKRTGEIPRTRERHPLSVELFRWHTRLSQLNISQAMARRDSRKGHVAGGSFVPALIGQHGTCIWCSFNSLNLPLPVEQRLKELSMGSLNPMNSVLLDSTARAVDPWAFAVLILPSRCCKRHTAQSFPSWNGSRASACTPSIPALQRLGPVPPPLLTCSNRHRQNKNNEPWVCVQEPPPKY